MPNIECARDIFIANVLQEFVHRSRRRKRTDAQRVEKVSDESNSQVQRLRRDWPRALAPANRIEPCPKIEDRDNTNRNKEPCFDCQQRRISFARQFTSISISICRNAIPSAPQVFGSSVTAVGSLSAVISKRCCFVVISTLSNFGARSIVRPISS